MTSCINQTQLWKLNCQSWHSFILRRAHLTSTHLSSGGKLHPSGTPKKNPTWNKQYHFILLLEHRWSSLISRCAVSYSTWQGWSGVMLWPAKAQWPQRAVPSQHGHHSWRSTLLWSNTEQVMRHQAFLPLYVITSRPAVGVPTLARKCLLKLPNLQCTFLWINLECIAQWKYVISILIVVEYRMYMYPMLPCVIQYLFCIPEAVLWDCCSFNYSLILKDQRSQPSTPAFHYNCAHTHKQAHTHMVIYASVCTHLHGHTSGGGGGGGGGERCITSVQFLNFF